MQIPNRKDFFLAFPRLNREIEPSSAATPQYNCIAWALGINYQWWEPKNPHTYWPSVCPDELSIDAYQEAFALFGYEPCSNGRLESSYEKIALYAKGKRPVHAARQLANGWWSSKCGKDVDIGHRLRELEGRLYGKVVKFFRRPKQCS